MGKANSGSGSLKRRREHELAIDTASQAYFFAKYLTSPELLDLEVCFVELHNLELHIENRTDRGHALPSTVHISASHPPPPPSYVHKIG